MGPPHFETRERKPNRRKRRGSLVVSIVHVSLLEKGGGRSDPRNSAGGEGKGLIPAASAPLLKKLSADLKKVGCLGRFQYRRRGMFYLP